MAVQTVGNLTVEVSPRSTTWVAGRDSVESLRSRELDHAILVEDGTLSKEDVRLVLSRLRARGEWRVTVIEGSLSHGWIREMFEQAAQDD